MFWAPHGAFFFFRISTAGIHSGNVIIIAVAVVAAIFGIITYEVHQFFCDVGDGVGGGTAWHGSLLFIVFSN